MLHTMTISGGPRAGKTMAALSYAKSAAETGRMVLILSPTYAASQHLALYAAPVLGDLKARVVFTCGGNLEGINGLYRTIIANDWDRWSLHDREDAEAYAQRCADQHGMAWLVKVQGEAVTAPAASLDSLLSAFTTALQARLTAAMAIPPGLLPAR
jgi:hypothetical protein